MSEARLKLAIDGVQGVVSGVRRVRESVGEATSAISGLASIGGALSVGAFAAFIKTQIDAADALSDLSAATNITVEDLSGLDWAAQLSGTTLDEVAKGVNKLSVEMGKNAEKFARLGVTAKEPLEAFYQLSDVLSQIEDPQKRAAVANAAFGQSWERLAPLLNEGGNNIRSMVERGKELSGVTTEMSEKAGKFNDDLDELKKEASKLGIEVATKLLPSLTNITTAMKEAAKEGGLLKAAWIGLGGVAAEVFGDSLERQIEFAQGNIKHLQEVIDNPGAWRNLTDWMGGETTKKNREELERWQATLDGLLAQKATLEKPAVSGKSTPGGGEPDVSGIIKDDAGKARDEAIKKSMDFMTQLEKETALVGATTAQKKSYEAEQIAVIMRKAGIGEQAVSQFLENHAREMAAYEEKLAAYERDEEIRKDMLRYSEELTNAGRSELETIVQQLQAERARNEEIGLTSEALADLIAHRMENEAAANREQAANLRAAAAYAGPLHDAYLQYAADLEAAADAKDALADEKRYGAARQKFVDDQKAAAEQAEQVWEDFGENVQRNLGDTFFSAMRGEFDNLGDAWLAMVQRMVSDALAADLTAALLHGGKGGGNMSALANGIGSFIGGLFGGSPSTSASYLADADMAGGLIPSFDGGGFTGNGLRSGGLDGKGGFLALMHPRETVTDHTKGQNGGANVSIQIIGAPSQPTVKETTDSRGNRDVRIVFGEMAGAEMRRSGSAMNQSARASFGLRPALVPR